MRREEKRGGNFHQIYLNHKHSFESVSLIMREGRFRDAEGNSEERLQVAQQKVRQTRTQQEKRKNIGSITLAD